MEQTLDKTINEIISTPNTIGCLFADKQGLCLSAKGNISTKAAGIAIAISEQACKLEPNANPPVISLDYGNKTCLIHKYGGLTGVIYKQSTGPK
ncbi:ragulator complex protein LAMTOR5 homolog [Condylostylus longicornis]|uniref:ragulator complex protein LAMTOR5 homolog n=1 Tax=Condylostylus longicornis TaxID=2530218 RepID=UPI00244DCE83|nr:ragulator complex protein LAMTOR5 homolog [Condylostylus longicornis]